MPNEIAREIEKIAEDLGIDRKRSIGEVAKILKVPTHVIRFWEENFPQIKPEIGSGKRRYYYNKQLKVLRRIKKFLYEEGYTIAGLQKLLNRKKHDENKAEDLEIIKKESSFNLTTTETNNPKVNHTIDDFLPTNNLQNFTTETPRAILKDFANIEIPAIDPRIKNSLLRHLKESKKALGDLKNLLKK